MSNTKEPVFQAGGLRRLAVVLTCFGITYALFYFIGQNVH